MALRAIIERYDGPIGLSMRGGTHRFVLAEVGERAQICAAVPGTAAFKCYPSIWRRRAALCQRSDPVNGLPPSRHAAVERQRLQMRSPDQALVNLSRHIRHGRFFAADFTSCLIVGI